MKKSLLALAALDGVRVVLLPPVVGDPVRHR